jgi:hypothetical protein
MLLYSPATRRNVVSVRIALALASLAWIIPAHAPAGPTPQPGPRIDLAKFTVDGVGLLSTPEEVRAALGAPEEEQRISAIVEEEEKERERGQVDEGEEALDTRAPAAQQGRFIYGYFTRGIRVVFLSETRRIESIDMYVKGLPPYDRFTGSFVQPFPTTVREADLLRPLASQIYRDTPNSLSLEKDDGAPKRETARLSFSVDGWLTRVTFAWEENFDIDFDRLSVGGVSLGDPTPAVLDRLGPPDRFGSHGKAHIGLWEREGMKIFADRQDGKVTRIVVSLSRFDGGCVQKFPLTQRKTAFHDYLKDRIYQESGARICAYRAGAPLSPEKLILKFDEDDRLVTLTLDITANVEVDHDRFTIGGLKIGDPASKAKQLFGTAGKWRRAGRNMILGYPSHGIRVHAARTGAPGAGKGKGFRWADLGAIRKIDALLETSPVLYGNPFSFGAMMKEWERDASRALFSKKLDTLYLSPDGRPPSPGVAALVEFEKIGWPKAVTLREFQDVVVDMKKFSVSGVTIGTHADRVLRLLGTPDRSRVIDRDNLEVMRYIEKGVVVVIDRLNRSVCKLTVQMDRFEGSFVQDLTPDSNADEFEKAVHAQVYTQDEKRLCLSRDGAPPTWEEGIVNFGLSGEVDTVVFQTLAVKKEGILLDITRELE